MKKSIYTALMGISLLCGCKSEPDKVKEMQESILREHGVVFQDADKITIYSLSPLLIAPDSEKTSGEIIFHGYKSYGSITLHNLEDIKDIWFELRDRVEVEGDIYTMCFDPRHGIRAYYGDRVHDYLICFECNHLYVYHSPITEEYVRIGLFTVNEPLTLNQIFDDNDIQRDEPK